MKKQCGEFESTASVLMFHSQYRNEGGEEKSFAEESALIERLGYNVHKTVSKNSEVSSTLLSALLAIFNPTVFFATLKSLRTLRPRFVYVNNLWMAQSPAVIWAARLARVPVIQAVRNYRLVCPSAKLANDGSCFNCGATRFPFRCVRNGCYNASRLQTAVVALSSYSNRIAAYGWNKHKYLATSQVTKDLIVAGGISERKVSVRPNFATHSTPPSFKPGAGITFVGRLSSEKGVRELVTEWCHLKDAPQLTLIGDGPLAQFVSSLAADPANRITWHGARTSSQVIEALRSSSWSIVPSQWAEPFGRVAIESMSVGTPVIYTDGGALKEIVGDTGFLLRSLSGEDLSRMLDNLPQESEMESFRKRAFRRFESDYSDAAAQRGMKQHISSLIK